MTGARLIDRRYFMAMKKKARKVAKKAPAKRKTVKKAAKKAPAKRKVAKKARA